MNEQQDILRNPACRENPFQTPEGYFDSLEARLMGRIAEESAAETQSRTSRPVWRILKPALTLAAMFALVFGMGYGVLSLTHTLNRGAAVEASGYATAEEELIRPASLINYYQTDPGEESEIDEETIINYLASELTFSDLAEIYAQAY